jgi:hypothetical protein
MDILCNHPAHFTIDFQLAELKVANQKLHEVNEALGAWDLVKLRDRISILEADNATLKNTLRSDEEQLKSLVDRNAALRDAAVIQHQNDEIELQKLTAENARLRQQLDIMDDMATRRDELEEENERLVDLLNRADFYTDHQLLACTEGDGCKCGLEVLSGEIHRVTIEMPKE